MTARDRRERTRAFVPPCANCKEGPFGFEAGAEVALCVLCMWLQPAPGAGEVAAALLRAMVRWSEASDATVMCVTKKEPKQ